MWAEHDLISFLMVEGGTHKDLSHLPLLLIWASCGDSDSWLTAPYARLLAVGADFAFAILSIYIEAEWEARFPFKYLWG